jgi:hypothetical protein
LSESFESSHRKTDIHRNLKSGSLKVKHIWGKTAQGTTHFISLLDFFRPNLPWHSIQYIPILFWGAHTLGTFSPNLVYFPWFNSASGFYISMKSDGSKEIKMRTKYDPDFLLHSFSRDEEFFD